MDHPTSGENPKRVTGGGVAEHLRRADPDRFLCGLFVPAAVREDGFALCCFHRELERAAFGAPGHSAHGPVAAMIRLGWWREVLADERQDWRGNPLAARIRNMADREAVPGAVLAGMVEDYEDAAAAADAAGPGQAAAGRGAGGLQEAIARLLGERDAGEIGRARAAGTAYALVRSGGDRSAAADEVRRLLSVVEGVLPQIRRRAPLLLAILAARDHAGSRIERTRGLADRLAVAWAGLRPGGRLAFPGPR